MKVSEFVPIRTRPLKGNKIGIEIEYVMRNKGSLQNEFLNGPVSNCWRWDRDGSLGEAGVEFVSKRPVQLTKAFEYLKTLEDAYNKSESRVVDSVRSGVHVHINVGDLTVKELVQYITMYLIFEGPLVAWCGDERVGNLFCLRATDAYGLMPVLIQAIRDKRPEILMTNELRYASVNPTSIPKYGSLEFRAMKSTDDFSSIRRWVRFLVRVKEAALEYNDPKEIVQDFSEQGCHGFLTKIFKDNYAVLERDDIDDLMMDGMMVAQDLAFCVDDWEEHFKQRPSNNPFDQGPRPRAGIDQDADRVAAEMERIKRIRRTYERAAAGVRVQAEFHNEAQEN